MLIRLSDSARLFHADCRDAIRSLPDNSIDSVVTDPPYALVSIVKRFGGANAAPAKGNDAYMRASAGFMQKSWDVGDVAFATEFWSEVLRVLKPGGHLAAFGGTRTQHRLVCAIEDAGFEIRDQLYWHYGSGFPKSQNVAKFIDRELGVTGSAIATGGPVKRMIPGADQNKDGWIKDDGREFVPSEYHPGSPEAQRFNGFGTALKPATEPICLARKPLSEGTVAANVLRWGTGALNIGACRVSTSDNLNGGAYSGGSKNLADATSYATGVNAGEYVQPTGCWPANVVHDGSDEVVGAFPNTGGGGTPRAASPNKGSAWAIGAERSSIPGGATYCDQGSAARFFYSAKASKADRAGSKHPTVKPVSLMEWLAVLITPPGGTILDPFAGSGTTGAAAHNKGFRAVLIEREAEYVEDIKRRFDPNAAPVEALRNVKGGHLDVTQPDPLARLLQWNAAVASYKSKVAA